MVNIGPFSSTNVNRTFYDFVIDICYSIKDIIYFVSYQNSNIIIDENSSTKAYFIENDKYINITSLDAKFYYQIDSLFRSDRFYTPTIYFWGNDIMQSFSLILF